MNLLDRAIAYVAPGAAARRLRARFAYEQMSLLREEAAQRFGYDAARTGRRRGDWAPSAGDANAMLGPSLGPLRYGARDLARNNSFARRALNELVGAQIGTGIVPRPATGSDRLDKQISEAFKRWADECDPSGEIDFYGIQHIVARAVPESGEVLVRFRSRRASDNLYVPLQLQVLEADFLDTQKSDWFNDGVRIINGVEFDTIDRRVAYWLFDEHPGATATNYRRASLISKRVPRYDRAGLLNVAHLYLKERPGQVRGASWFASVTNTLRDIDGFDEAVWMRKRMEACVGLILTSPEGEGMGLGATEQDEDGNTVEEIQPGMIMKMRPGQEVTAFDPKSGSGDDGYRNFAMQRVSAGLGPMVEQITGDFANMTYSSFRGGRLSFQHIVDSYRWVCFIPQFLRPTYRRFIDAAYAAGRIDAVNYGVRWTAPKVPTVDPVKDAEAYKNRVRCGFDSWEEVVSEHGYDPEEQMATIAAWQKRVDAAGVVLDCDPRKTADNGSRPDKGAQDGKPAER